MTLLWMEATSFGRGRDIFVGKKITSVLLLYLRRDLIHITLLIVYLYIMNQVHTVLAFLCLSAC